MSRRARLRRWWWRHVRRHHGEICHQCGKPVGVFWLVPDHVWKLVAGGPGLWCIPCFDGAAGGLQWTAQGVGARGQDR